MNNFIFLSSSLVTNVQQVDDIFDANDLHSFGKVLCINHSLPFSYIEKNLKKKENKVTVYDLNIQTLDSKTVRVGTKRGNKYDGWVICNPSQRDVAEQQLQTLFSPAEAVAGVDQCRQAASSLLRDLNDSATAKKSLRDYALARAIAGLGPEMKENIGRMRQLGLVPSLVEADLSTLPPGSFAVQFEFELLDHWFSRDDHPFYPIENPVRKETVFNVPEMAAAGWKGVFRQACRELDESKASQLFGESLDDDTGNEGALRFFPSFFEAGRACPALVRPHVINPQDRSTKAGRSQGPITIEVVAPGARSRFVLLYVSSREKTHRAEHARLVTDLVEQVFTASGFGAKTSVGFGRAAIIPDSKTERKKPESGTTVAAGSANAKKLKNFNQLKQMMPSQGKKQDHQEPSADSLPANRLLIRDAAGVVSTTSFQSFNKLKKLLQRFATTEGQP